MKVRYNEDEEIVRTVKEGLLRRGGYWRKTKIQSACARKSGNRFRILILKGIVTACCTIKKNNDRLERFL